MAMKPDALLHDPVRNRQERHHPFKVSKKTENSYLPVYSGEIQRGKQMVDLADELRGVLKDLKGGKTATPVTIRTFLSWFGMQRRTASNVEYINSQLKAAGVRTVPNYLDIWVDTPITFELTAKRRGDGPDSTAPAPAVENSTDMTFTDSKSADDPSFRIGKIESANRAPISVRPTASLQEAITLMLARNFSQLPVMTTDREVKGVISWESIGARNITKTDGTQAQHFMDDAQEISASASLFAGIKIILDHNYVLIRASDRRIAGIVTSTDITHQFEETSGLIPTLGAPV